MQYTEDGLNIHILNSANKNDLLGRPDLRGSNLVALRQACTGADSFQCAGLGHVELRHSIYAFRASIGMKVDGQPAAFAELVWHPSASKLAWASLNQFHSALSATHLRDEPWAPTTPWLGISVIPGFNDHPTPSQRAVLLSVLLGRAYRIRLRVRDSTCFN